MRDPKHPRKFTEEFKRQIVALYDGGKPAAEIMREYDLGRSTFRRWVKLVHETGSTRAADGLGLGLTSAHDLTRLMGGRIEVETRPGVGSLFRVILPLQRVT